MKKGENLIKKSWKIEEKKFSKKKGKFSWKKSEKKIINEIIGGSDF